jgi:hypothetical protein
MARAVPVGHQHLQHASESNIMYTTQSGSWVSSRREPTTGCELEERWTVRDEPRRGHRQRIERLESEGLTDVGGTLFFVAADGLHRYRF